MRCVFFWVRQEVETAGHHLFSSFYILAAVLVMMPLHVVVVGEFWSTAWPPALREGTDH